MARSFFVKDIISKAYDIRSKNNSGKMHSNWDVGPYHTLNLGSLPFVFANQNNICQQ
jgi:hypothetical protein